MVTLSNKVRAAKLRFWSRVALVLCTSALLGACANVSAPPSSRQAHIPLQQGWFEGQAVFYVTTDVSVADLALAKQANFAPRLAHVLSAPLLPGTASAVDKVYGSVNFEQGSVFASAPSPMGHRNTDAAYSPLWRLVKVEWQAGATPHTLKSEEDVLMAQDKGWVTLTTTQVVLNCPIVHRGGTVADGLGGLPGVTVDAP